MAARESLAPRGLFVGRPSELASLEAAWDDAQRGIVPVLLVGEAGIGKSRLVTEFLRRCHVPSYIGYAVPVGGVAMPFGPWASLLRGMPRDLVGRLPRGLSLDTPPQRV